MKLTGRIKNNFLPYTYAPSIAAALILTVFMRKGVYPFGSKTLDYMDMGQVNAPMYYHLYDAMRGTKSLFFDWYTAAGINMAESVSICSLLSPLNLFFYFVPRERILESLSLFTMLKVSAMAASMFVFLHKKFSADIFWKVLFSLCYAFSGFTLQYYCNSQWLDVAAIFPLLALSAWHLLQNNRVLPYTVTLAACLIVNFYNSSMILMFLFFTGGLYFILLAPRDGRKERIWSFCTGTAAALGLSAFIVLPAFVQMSHSARVGGTDSGMRLLLDILNAENFADSQKWHMLFGLAPAAVIVAKGILASRKDKKTVLFITGSIFIVTLQICFENINLIWHAGSYVAFPLRFGYMINFVLLSASCFYVPRVCALPGNVPDLREEPLFRKICGVIIVFCMAALAFLLISGLYGQTAGNGSYLNAFAISSAILLLFYPLSLNNRGNVIARRAAGTVLASTLLAGVYIFIPPDPRTVYDWPELSSDFIGTAQRLRHELAIVPSRTDRIKNTGNTLNANYPFILERAALSNYTHTVPDAVQQNFKKLGYSIHYTRLLDSGGTVFSDALLGVKQTLSICEQDESMYTLSRRKGRYRLYENNYTLPFGITVSSGISSLNGQYDNAFEYQNALFECISGQVGLIEPLITDGNLNPALMSVISEDSDGGRLKLEYAVRSDSNHVLYLCPKGDVRDTSFYIDGKAVPIPSIGGIDNTSYPFMFNGNMLCLGSLSNRTVNLTIECPADTDQYQFDIGLLDLGKLERFTKSYEGYTAHEEISSRGMSLTVTGSAEKDMLFLPVTYDKGWSCTVNGLKADVIPVVNTFIGVKLEEGVNEVRLSFFPHGMKAGILISLSTLMILATSLFVTTHTRVKPPEKLCRITEIFFHIFWYATSVAVYIVPVFYTLINKVVLRD